MSVEGLAVQYVDFFVTVVDEAARDNSAIQRYNGELVKKCISTYSTPKECSGYIQYVINMIVECVKFVFSKTTWQETVDMITSTELSFIPADSMRPESDDSPAAWRGSKFHPKSVMIREFNKSGSDFLKFFIQLNEAGEQAIDASQFNDRVGRWFAFVKHERLNGSSFNIGLHLKVDSFLTLLVKLPGITKEFYTDQLNGLPLTESSKLLLAQQGLSLDLANLEMVDIISRTVAVSIKSPKVALAATAAAAAPFPPSLAATAAAPPLSL